MAVDRSQQEGEESEKLPLFDWPVGLDMSDDFSLAHGRVTDQLRSIMDLLHNGRATEDELAEIGSHLAAAKKLAAVLPADHALEIEVPKKGGEANFDFPATSPVSGRVNAVAPPMVYEKDPSAGKTTVAHVTFGRRYEGPPGHVHGGWVAAVLDEILGRAQRFSGQMGMTGRLEIRYRAPSPLYKRLRASATFQSLDGRKVTVKGDLCDGDRTLATATGVFVHVDFEAIRPESARD